MFEDLEYATTPPVIQAEVHTELTFSMEFPAVHARFVFVGPPKPEHYDQANRIIRALSDEFKKENTHG